MSDLDLKPLPARGKQIKELENLFGSPTQYTPSSIFIYGHSSCGKSVVIDHVMKKQNLNHVIVNCIECYMNSLLFLEILNGLDKDEDKIVNKCENMNDLVRGLRNLLSDNNETSYIIFDKCERLRNRDVNLLPGLVNLQELTSCNLCVIFVSELPWDKFYSGIGIREPHILFFPDYNKDELVEVLCHLRSPAVEYEFYRHYISMVLAVFSVACRDLRELRHLAEMNFSIYCEPIKNGNTGSGDKHKLWKNVEPHLRNALQKLYMREMSSKEWEKVHENKEIKKSSKNIVELPFYSKFLLIAAYIASYNPVQTDRRFFLKNAGRMKKTVRSMKKDEKKNAHLRGPHNFPLDRLMAIFYSIVDERVPPSAHIFSQITSLVSLHLIMQIGHDDQIDIPKYKCNISLEFITNVAKTVNFDVVKYLFDFV